MIRRAALRRAAPINRKRVEPRIRARGRVRHERMQERTIRATAEQKRFWASLPSACQACGAPGAVIHHLLSDAPGKAGRRDHWFVVRLCPWCHNIGSGSVHLLGSEQAFRAATGVDLIAIAVANRATWSTAPCSI